MRFFRRFNFLIAAVAAGGAWLLLGGCDNHAAMNQSTANVKHIAEAEFTAEVTQCPQPVVVDFYATWCGPCRELAPMLDRAAGGYAGKIKFVKVNVDEAPALAQRYEISGIPHVLMFKHGQVIQQMLGLPQEADLKSDLDKFAAAK